MVMGQRMPQFWNIRSIKAVVGHGGRLFELFRDIDGHSSAQKLTHAATLIVRPPDDLPESIQTSFLRVA